MMVDFFRRKMKAFIWLIIVTFALSIFFIAAGSFFYGDGQTTAEQQAQQQKKAEETPSELEFNATQPVASVQYKGKTETVTEGELNRTVKSIHDNSPVYRTTPIKSFKAMMSVLILDNLVKERLVAMEAESLPLDVTKEVNEFLDKRYQQAGGKEQFLANVKMTEPELRKNVERQFKQEHLVRTMTAGKTVPDKEIETYYDAHKNDFKKADGKGVRPLAEVRGEIVAKLRSQVSDADIKAYYEQHRIRWKQPDRVTVRHLMLDPAADRWKKDAKVTSEEVSRYYEEHKADYRAPKKVHLRHIFVDPASDAFAADAKVSEDELRSLFDEKFPAETALNLSEIVLPFGKDRAARNEARDRAEKVREKLQAGEPFAAVAMAHTTGPLAAKGGDRGSVKPSELAKDLADAVKELAVGQISPVVESEDAFHILQVTGKSNMPERDPAREKEFESKKAELSKEAETDKREEAAKKKLSQLRASLAHASPTTGSSPFEEAARKESQAKSASAGGDLGTIALGENKDNPKLDEIGASGFVDEAITDAVTDLSEGELSQPVQSARGFHLLQLVSVLPTEYRPLAGVQKEIEQKLLDQKAEQAVAAAVERIRQELSGTAKDGKKPNVEGVIKAESNGADAAVGGLWKDLVLSEETAPALSDKVREEVYSMRGLHPKIVDALRPLEVGKVSDAVSFGHTRHLFVMERREPATFAPLDDKISQEIREVLNPEVTETEAREYFDAHKDEFSEPAKIRLRHILFYANEEDQAKDVLEQALKNVDFEYLAGKFSKDPTTRKSGGEITSDVVIPSIRQALQDAEVGKVYPRLVKSHLGWHVLQLVERKPPVVASFETAKKKILERLMPEKREKVLKAWIAELENQAIIRKFALK